LIRKRHKRPRAPRGRQVFEEIRNLVTERTNSRSRRIDRMTAEEILRVINAEDATVAGAVKRELPYIARAVEMTVTALKAGRRLFYIGAGTSGRLGVLDAAECPPTFGTDPNMIKGIIAGGKSSLVRSSEGVEDDVAAAIRDVRRQRVGPGDLVIGITASKRTPYVLEGLAEAGRLGAKTIFITCNPRKMAPAHFDLAICPVVGPEVIAGSSRMKAGTAQKMILNMISTTAMIRMGRIYGNRMVDLKGASEKLKERSKKVLMETCNLSYAEAQRLLKRAGGSAKTAIVMSKGSFSMSTAERLLKEADGFIHLALKHARKAAIAGSRREVHR